MSGLWYFWGSLALLLGGYFVYGAFVEKVFGADFGRPTPVKSRRDGVDYICLLYTSYPGRGQEYNGS